MAAEGTAHRLSLHQATDGDGDQLQITSSAPIVCPGPAAQPDDVNSLAGVAVSISAQTYARLVSLADQAPIECLALSPRTLASARTLGYNHIGQIRSTPLQRLLQDLGEERADELRQALHDFGLREQGGPGG